MSYLFPNCKALFRPSDVARREEEQHFQEGQKKYKTKKTKKMIEEVSKRYYVEKGFGKGFEKGWNALPINKTQEVRKELMKALGIDSRRSFIAYKKGRRDMRVSQALAVDIIFMKHHIEDCWDI